MKKRRPSKPPPPGARPTRGGRASTPPRANRPSVPPAAPSTPPAVVSGSTPPAPSSSAPETGAALRHLAVAGAIVLLMAATSYVVPQLHRFRPWIPGERVPLTHMGDRFDSPASVAAGGGYQTGTASPEQSEALGAEVAAVLAGDPLGPEDLPAAEVSDPAGMVVISGWVTPPKLDAPPPPPQAGRSEARANPWRTRIKLMLVDSRADVIRGLLGVAVGESN